MIPLIDIVDETEVTSETFVNVFSREPRPGKVIRIREIFIGANSVFKAEGKVTISIDGTPITSSGQANNEIGLIGNLSIRFGDDDLILLETGSKFEIDAKITDGETGIIQPGITGVELTQEEKQILLQRKGLD